MKLLVQDAETRALIDRYVARLALPVDNLRVTTDRATFESWLGRRVSGGIGGAYAFLSRVGEHVIFINLARIDRTKPRALEIVVAEELIHMQDRLAGDQRRHAKHGYDRIALRVAEVTGATLDDIRSCLIPRESRPYRYVYRCSRCGAEVPRKVRGSWACGPCFRGNGRRYPLKLVATHDPAEVGNAPVLDDRVSET